MSVRPGFEHCAESLLADHGALIWWSPPVLYLKYCHRLCFSFDPHFQQLCVHHTLSYTDARRRIFLWTWQWAPKNSAPWTSLIPLNKLAIFTTAWFWLNIVIVILDLNKKTNWSRNQTWSWILVVAVKWLKWSLCENGRLTVLEYSEVLPLKSVKDSWTLVVVVVA